MCLNINIVFLHLFLEYSIEQHYILTQSEIPEAKRKKEIKK